MLNPELYHSTSCLQWVDSIDYGSIPDHFFDLPTPGKDEDPTLELEDVDATAPEFLPPQPNLSPPMDCEDDLQLQEETTRNNSHQRSRIFEAKVSKATETGASQPGYRQQVSEAA